jgi:AcrR family transcriptional regulator
MAEIIREPQQKRSRDSLQRVLDAGALLFEEQGFDQLTIQQVSERSGVSVGAIYARFGNKENLVREVVQHGMGRIRESTVLLAAGEWTNLEPEELIRETVRRASEVFRIHRDFLRAAMHLGAIDEVVASRGSEGSQRSAGDFKARLLEELDGHIAHDDPDLAVDVCFRMMYSTLARQVMFGPTFESPRMIEWDDLIGEIGAACAAYLLRG